MTSSTRPSGSSGPSTPSARLTAASTVGGADHLVVDGVSKSFTDRRVLTDVSFTVSSGERACLIGENGTGKTTLLRIIAGLDDDHAGRISAPGRIGLYHQQPPFDLVLTVDEVLAEATAPQRRLADEVARLAEALATEGPAPDAGAHGSEAASPHAGAHGPGATSLGSGDRSGADDGSGRLADAYDRALAEAIRSHAWDVEHATDRLVQGLDLAGIPRDRPAGQLSGGQQSRLSLAWLLLRHPDTLLLDEPTNHLDDRGAALLVELLTDWSGPVLIASHDRAFLDEVATTLLDLDPASRPHREVRSTGADGRGEGGPGGGAGIGITRFGGTYTDYLLHRIEERTRWEKRYRDEQDALRRLRRQVKDSHSVGRADRPPRTEARAARKFYADRNAKVVARRVNDAATALDRLERDQIRRPPPVLRFAGLAAATGGGADHAPSRPASSGPVLVATGVAFAGRLAPVFVALGARSRLLVTGANGAGKTTLLRILAGLLEPDAGTVTGSAGAGRVRVGMLGQEPVPTDPAATVVEAYRAAVGTELAERVPLGTLGLLAGHDEQRPVGTLSVGQRRRLNLAVLLADPPEVLLLDEPTNHFSLLLATRLEASIPDYPGAVVIATHDRWLRAGWRGDRLHLDPPG